MYMIELNPNTIPAVMPAMKRLPTDTPVTAPKMIKVILGGITSDTAPADASRPPEKLLPYPPLTSSGNIILPIAMTVAGLDPDNDPKNMLATWVVKATPPARCPTKSLENLSILLDRPPASMMLAARMKKGSAIKEN